MLDRILKYIEGGLMYAPFEEVSDLYREAKESLEKIDEDIIDSGFAKGQHYVRIREYFKVDEVYVLCFEVKYDEEGIANLVMRINDTLEEREDVVVVDWDYSSEESQSL